MISAKTLVAEWPVKARRQRTKMGRESRSLIGKGVEKGKDVGRGRRPGKT